jgi:hypothetical protein
MVGMPRGRRRTLRGRRRTLRGRRRTLRGRRRTLRGRRSIEFSREFNPNSPSIHPGHISALSILAPRTSHLAPRKDAPRTSKRRTSHLEKTHLVPRKYRCGRCGTCGDSLVFQKHEDLTYLTFLNPMRIQIESATDPIYAAINSHTPAHTSHEADGGCRRLSFGQ